MTEHHAVSDDPRDGPDEPGDGTAPISRLLTGETDEVPALDPPLFWPEIAAEDAAAKWQALRRWVDRLSERFDFDFRTLPGCWYRHNAMVEALVALRDHERASFADTAPLTAAVDWHRALRDVEGRLREWTSRTGCLARHVQKRKLPPLEPTDDWETWVDVDVHTRRTLAVAAALGGPAC